MRDNDVEPNSDIQLTKEGFDGVGVKKVNIHVGMFGIVWISRQVTSGQ